MLINNFANFKASSSYLFLSNHASRGLSTFESTFLRDLGITIESIKALIKRDFGQHHPMHIITDSLIKIGTLPNGQKATNINYNQIFHKIKKKAEEQTVEFELDPDIKLD